MWSSATARRCGIASLVCVAIAASVWGVLGWALPLPVRPATDGPTIRLYAGNEEIAVLHGLSRRAQIWRSLDEFPKPVVDAVLTAEDRRFFRHGGIDLWAVIRAGAANLRQGGIRQGGSTITQQLARTLFLSGERVWGRKVREAALALLIELRYSKPRILEAYLNTIYLGHDGDIAVHGLAAAARHFLRKDLATIRPDEAALLAAAISSPNKVLADVSGRGRTGRDAVLTAMERRGIIDATHAREALARPLPTGPTDARLHAPYFVELVRDEMARRLTLPSSGEVRVASSLDPSLQRVAEQAIQQGLSRLERRRAGAERGRIEAALVALDPVSGRIRALVGGRGYQDSPFNRATRAVRQPGSLFKPFVYLTAFESGQGAQPAPFTPASLVADEPLTVRDGDSVWTPRNIDGQLLGGVTVRRALQESRNIPAVRVAQEVGPDRIADTARRLGIASPLAKVPSLALGTSEVTLLEITRAYAALANQGVRTTPTTLGADPVPAGAAAVAPLPVPERAVSAESAFLITHLLRGVMRDGTAKSSARWGLSEVSAGKTGSTDNLRDAWFVGYTPDLVVGVWVGLDDGSPLGFTGAQAALPIWATVMSAAVRRTAPRPFAPPPGVVMVAVNRETGKPASFWCNRGATVEEAFRAGTEPSANCGPAALAHAGRGLLNWFAGLFR
jgi:penicillin-binding protein 1B